MNGIGPNDQSNHQQIKKPPTPPPKPPKRPKFGDHNRSAEKSDENIAPQTAQGVRAPNGNFGDQKSVTVLEHQDSSESGIALDGSFDESPDSMSEKENMSPDIKGKVGGQLFRAELETRLQKTGQGGHGDRAPKAEHEGSGIQRRAGKKWRGDKKEVKGKEPDGKIPISPEKSPAEVQQVKIQQMQRMLSECLKSIEKLECDKNRYGMLPQLKKDALEAYKELLWSKSTIPPERIGPFAQQFMTEVKEHLEEVDKLVKYPECMSNAMKLVKEKKPDLNKASSLFDQLDLEGMRKISEHTKSGNKDLILVVNSKLFKLQLIEFSDKEGLFRTVGSKRVVSVLTENMSKKPLTKVKTKKTDIMASGPVLDQAKALASYAKDQLRSTYCIQGSSKESYKEVFDRLKTEKDRIVFIDLLDAVHYFCSHLPPYSQETLSVETVDAALGPALYGLYIPGDLMPGDMPGQFQECKVPTPKGRVNDFLEQWPLAKVEMMESLKT
ncbi:hypothetical protein [Endozoicomonas atrinae]|uniref:hypothetical protein n=1 Tax=Endozoicomonas atrinae TaxID=1333660 RepID=UPI003AFFD6AF